MMIRILFLSIIFTLFAASLAFGAPSVFLSDEMEIDLASGVIIAKGNIEIARDEYILKSGAIRYNSRDKTFEIPGYFEISTASGDRISGQSGTLSENLENVFIKEAIFVLEAQFKIAASELLREKSGTTILRQSFGTTCQFCDQKTPFWQIRAREIRHVAADRRLYFKNAIFELLGVPLLYTPRASIPDPTVRRATGFLVPSISTAKTLGFGAKFPYYIVASDHADITLTPHIFTNGSVLFGTEYRQYFTSGSVETDFKLAFRDVSEFDQTRAMLDSTGEFVLPSDWHVNFDLALSSNRTFRSDFSLSDADRLYNEAILSKTGSSFFYEIGASTVQSLRVENTGTDTNDNRPVFSNLVFPEIYLTDDWEFRKGLVFRNTVHSALISEGAKEAYFRSGARMTLSHDTTTKAGLSFQSFAQIDATLTWTQKWRELEDEKRGDLRPSIGTEITYPLIKHHANGARSYFAPKLQFIASSERQMSNPNEDSLQVEFETSNLFAFSKFPGFDAVERGTRLNLGFHYNYQSNNDFKISFAAGQVFRERDLDQFDQSIVAGLTGVRSDTAFALSLEFGEKLALLNRGLISDDLKISKNELSLIYQGADLKSNLSYIWLEDDVIFSQNSRHHQIDVDFAYQINKNWLMHGGFSQNIRRGQSIERKLGFEYTNECVKVNIDGVFDDARLGPEEPEFEIGLSIELLGFGARGGTRSSSQRCGASY